MDSLFHAYLIEGSGDRLRDEVTDLCLRILCPNSPPCKKCSVCEKVLSGNHTDIKTTGPVKVTEMREWLGDLWLSASDGERKIYIVNDADDLSEYSQNTLLLPIEDPPENTFFIICCKTFSKILPTVKSRCRTVVLSSESSNGEADELCRAFLTSLFRGDSPSVFSSISDKKDGRDAFGDFVAALCIYCREKIKRFSSEKNDVDTALYLSLLSVAEKWSARNEMNLNMTLTVTGFVFECRECIKLWSSTRAASSRASR